MLQSTVVEDRGAWHAITHGVTKSQTQLRDRTTPTNLTTNSLLLTRREVLPIDNIKSINTCFVCYLYTYSRERKILLRKS